MIGIGTFCATILAWGRPNIVDHHQSSKWRTLGTFSSAILQRLALAAFIFLSLAVMSYVECVGIVALASTAAYGIVAIAIIIKQELPDQKKRRA
jgi:hypothetical protein